MRTSIVPAQITTAEDKIIGNISMQQTMLLAMPILVGFAAALIFPPWGHFSGYKVVITSIAFVIGGVLAIRIKDRILAQWFVMWARYMSRPHYYIYDKNSTYLRISDSYNTPEFVDIIEAKAKNAVAIRPTMEYKEFVRLEQFARDSRTNLRFEVNKKGKLKVHLTEVK